MTAATVVLTGVAPAEELPEADRKCNVFNYLQQGEEPPEGCHPSSAADAARHFCEWHASNLEAYSTVSHRCVVSPLAERVTFTFSDSLLSRSAAPDERWNRIGERMDRACQIMAGIAARVSWLWFWEIQFEAPGADLERTCTVEPHTTSLETALSSSESTHPANEPRTCFTVVAYVQQTLPALLVSVLPMLSEIPFDQPGRWRSDVNTEVCG